MAYGGRMEHLRQAAYVSIGRACGFAGLAVLCVVIGLSYEPLLAARTGGVLTTAMTAVLIMKSRHALHQDLRRTELWTMLDKKKLPPEPYANWAGSTVLRDAYLWFAKYAAAVSVVLWAIAGTLTLIG